MRLLPVLLASSLVVVAGCEKKPIAKMADVKGFWQDKEHPANFLNVSDKAVIFAEGSLFTRYKVEKLEEQPGKVYFTTKAMTRKSGEKSFFVSLVPQTGGELDSHVGANVQHFKRVGDPAKGASSKMMGSWRIKMPGVKPAEAPVIKLGWDEVTWINKGKSESEPLIVTAETADSLTVQSGKDTVKLTLKGKELEMKQTGGSQALHFERI